ncbi:hypothetical protein D9M73_186940 [compost metagenome]
MLAAAVLAAQAHPGRDPRPGQENGPGTRRGRPDERADGGAGRRYLRHRSESARLAYRAVRFQVHRRLAGQGGGSRHGRQEPEGNRLHRGDHPAVLQRQGSGVPVRQVPGCRPDPRPGNEVHRRGDGRGQDLRRGLRQGPDGCQRGSAELRHRVHQRARGRQADGGPGRP